MESWAAGEKLRRQEWIAGPSEEEKHEWAERQTGGFSMTSTMPLFEDVMGWNFRR